MTNDQMQSIRDDLSYMKALAEEGRRTPTRQILPALETPLVAESPVRPPEHTTPTNQPVRPGGPTEQEQQKPNEFAPEHLRPSLQQTKGVAIPRPNLVAGQPPRRRCRSTVFVANCAPVAH